MKLLYKLLLLVALFFVLVACSDSDETSKESDNETDTTETDTTNEEETEEPDDSGDEETEEPDEEPAEGNGGSSDLAKIFSSMEAAAGNVQSQSSQFDMTMVMEGGAESGSFEFHFTTDEILDTGEHHMKGEMVIDAQGESMNLDMEVYQTLDAVYTSTSMFGGGWIVDHSAANEPFSMSMTESLQYFNGMEEQFNVTEKDGKLVLTLDESQFESYDLFLSYAALSGQSGIDPDSLGDVNFKINKFEYVINPETNLFESMSYDIDMSGTDGATGEDVSLKMTFDYVVLDYNHLDSIVVPQEVIDEANQGMDFDMDFSDFE